MFKRILNTGKSGLSKIILTGGLIASFILPTGCGSSGGGGGGPAPNTPPAWSGNYDTSAREKVSYSSNGASATDADGDTITYSKIQGPTFLNVNSSTGGLSGTPDDSEAAQTFPTTIRAHDGTDYSDNTFNLSVENVGTAFGYVEVMGSGEPGTAIDGAEVVIGTQSDTTNSSGYWEIQDIPDGTYAMSVTDSLGTTYETYKTNFEVSKTKEDAGKLEKDLRMFEQADRVFVNETLRFNGEVRNPAQRYTFNIYTIEWQSSTRIAQSEIDETIDVIKTDISQFFNETFEDLDINIIETLPPIPQPADGVIHISYDDGIAGQGINISYLDADNNVLSGKAVLKSTASRGVKIQETAEAGIDEAESNDKVSIFNDPLGVNTLQPKDFVISEGLRYRPTGNKDYGTSDNHDSDPVGFIVNKSAFTAYSKSAKTQTIELDDSEQEPFSEDVF